MSAQPSEMLPMWLCEPTRAESYGSITSHTLRFAAGLFDDTRSVTRADPEMCTVSLSTGVAYSTRCVDVAALAFALPLIATSSTMRSVPDLAAVYESDAIALPPAVGCSTTGAVPGTGNDANGLGGPAGRRRGAGA